jgi:protein-tyrosine-phosphatase
MAEVMFIDHLKRSGLDPAQWQVESAGTRTETGYPASLNSVEVMKERGMDLSRHLSRVVTAELLAQFNLILVMESNHKEALTLEFSSLADRIFMLSEMAGEKKTVEDPIGQEISAYRKCADEILDWIEQGWENIQRLA